MPMTLTLSAIERLRTYASFVRFEHTLFSLPLVLAGVFSQRGPALTWVQWLLILAAAVGARTAALALNRLIDRRMDALNPRTQRRELPSGRMKLAEAAGLLGAGGLVYVAAAGALSPLCLKLTPVPLAVFMAYPFLKRFTPLCHFGVGMGLALAPLAGYVAAHPDFAHPLPAVLLAMFALFWVTGFDIIYATLDEEFDRASHVHSLVVRLGRTRALKVSGALHALAGACVAAAGLLLLGGGFTRVPLWGTLATLLTLLGLAELLYLEQRWAEDVDLAFFKVNVVVGFATLLLVLVARAAAGW